MNKEFREFLVDEFRQVREMNGDILSGYGAGVNDSYAYILKKYDEFHKPVVVPDFVAEWIESPDRDLDDMYIWESPQYVYDWTFGKGDSLENSRYKDLLDAIDNGYEVEEEQKYYVLTSSNKILLIKDDGEVRETYQAYSWIKKRDKEHYQLTEQEIKDYDERYMAFAVKVEDVE